MDRRQFLALSAAAPWLLPELAAEAGEGSSRSSTKLFPLLEVEGSYREIGYQIGRRFRSQIRTVIKNRSEWHRGLLELLDTTRGRSRSLELQRLTRRHFPHLLEELRGMAEGTGLAFDAMWAMTIKSELGALDAEPPGCSTIQLSAGERCWLAHNEDGHVAYYDQMFLVRVRPPSGVRFISMVYPGILTGNGPSLNSEGVVQSTNYISSTSSEIGLPRYVIGRAILEAADLEEARQIATVEPRAYPYHHNLGALGDGRLLSVETVPGAVGVHSPDGLWVHTNHLLHPDTRALAHEDLGYTNSSSMSRFEVLTELTKDKDAAELSPRDLLDMLSSHERAPYSPCRHPKDEIKGQTLGTAFVDLGRGSFRLYRGNPGIAVPGNKFIELTV